MKIKFFLFFILSVGACDYSTESVRFEHEILEKKVIEQFKIHNLDYKQDDYGNYWYFVKDRSTVNNILKTQTDIIASSIEISDKKLADVFENKLALNEIKYKTEDFSDSRVLYLFYKDDYERAKQLLADSMDDRF